jgi:hypothetical protein
MRRIGFVLLVTTCALAARGAHADAVRFAPTDVTTVFVIAKSENRNQVAYAILLDAQCAPRGNAPVLAYWQNHERGLPATEPLAAHEHGAYGLASQSVTARGANGGSVRVALRALPSRTITIETSKQGERCVASATLAIGGTPARLTSVYAQLKWPFGVEYLMLNGTAIAGGQAVREKIAR